MLSRARSRTAGNSVSLGSISGILVLPYFLFLVLIFGIPILYIVCYSVGGSHITGAYFLRVFTVPAYREVALNTAFIAALVTIICLFIGYPMALLMSRVGSHLSRLLVLCVLVPFWTSILVRTYAWLVLLQKHGLINELGMRSHLLHRPTALVHNFAGVVLGMTYVLIPYMILSIYVTLRNVDERLLLVAATLGADRFTIFRRITLPLSAPGVVAGSLIVFSLALGFFITPALLGGLHETTIGMVIEAQVNRILDWNFGAAIAVTLAIIAVGIGVVGSRWIDLGSFANPEV